MHLLLIGAFLFNLLSLAQNLNLNYNKFEQMHEGWPTPNTYRNAAGAPGHEYWQQQADYDISFEVKKQ